MTSRQDRRALRRRLREQRRALDRRSQHQAARALVRHLFRHRLWRQVHTLAAFCAADGEPDLWPLMHAAHRAGRRVHLPVIAAPAAPMGFREWRPGRRLTPNRLGIPEPVDGTTRHPRRMDLVLTPLVGFDAAGNRLGMGGGFYDRTFAFLHRRRRWHHPRLVGVAHDFQQVDTLAAEPWDVPLWGILTPSGLRRFPLGQ